MAAPGPRSGGPAPISWDEARELILIVLLVCATAMVLSPILARLIDGQLNRDGIGSAVTGAQPTTGLIVLAASILVATTPPEDLVPTLRRATFQVALLVAVIGLIAMLDVLFSPAAGGVRNFFARFPAILRFSGPATLMAGIAAWTARRVVAFPGD